MNLTKTQIEQVNDIIEKYGFCSLETQKKLQEAGFFEEVKCNFSLCFDEYDEKVELWGNGEEPFLTNRFHFVPMPQMGEVWKVLPKEIEIGGDSHYLHLYLNIMGYLDNANDYADGLILNTDAMSETEAMCQLWLKLHKENLL